MDQVPISTGLLLKVAQMLQGSLDNFSLGEVLSLLADTDKTGRLRVSGDRGTGSLWLDEGQLVAATGPNNQDGTVQDVVFEIMRFKSGNFSFTMDEKPESSADMPQLVDIVVTTAGERLAEWHEIEAVVPSLDHILTPQAELEDDEITLSRDQWRLLIAVGPRSAVSEVCNGMDLGEVDGSRMMKTMIERGLLEISEDARGRDAESTDAESTEVEAAEVEAVEAVPEAIPVVAPEPAAVAEAKVEASPGVDDMFAPAAEVPVAEMPVAEMPAAEAPVVEAPVVEAPVVEAPVVEAPVVEAPVVEAPVAEAPDAVVPTPPAAESAAPLGIDAAFDAPTAPVGSSPTAADIASSMPPPPSADDAAGLHTAESLAQSLADNLADGTNESAYPFDSTDTLSGGSIGDLPTQDDPFAPVPSLSDMFANPVDSAPDQSPLPESGLSDAALHADRLVEDVADSAFSAAPDPGDLIEHASFEDASAFLGDDVPPPPPAPRSERDTGMIPPPPAPSESDLSDIMGLDADSQGMIPPAPGPDAPPSPSEIDSFRNAITDTSDLDAPAFESADAGFDTNFDADSFGDFDSDVAASSLGGLIEDDPETEEKGSLLMRYLKSER